MDINSILLIVVPVLLAGLAWLANRLSGGWADAVRSIERGIRQVWDEDRQRVLEMLKDNKLDRDERDWLINRVGKIALGVAVPAGARKIREWMNSNAKDSVIWDIIASSIERFAASYINAHQASEILKDSGPVTVDPRRDVKLPSDADLASKLSGGTR